MSNVLINFYNTYLNETSVVSGPKEKEGPLGNYFDYSFSCEMGNELSYEKAEIEYSKTSLAILFKKTGNFHPDICFGGDLTDEIAISNQVAMQLDNSFVGVYGACSTLILSMIMGSVFVSNNIVNSAVAFTSSNYGTAERQFRYPINYGCQKKETTTITTTGGVSCYISRTRSKIKITRGTIGNVEDIGWDNAYDMGSPMTYAAYKTIKAHIENTNTLPKDYDLILTGDLSKIGSKILIDMFKKEGIDFFNHVDGGCLIYGNEKKYFSGGSGAACIGLVGLGYVKKMMELGRYKRVLMVGTGALHSKTCVNQKSHIPVVAHAIELEVEDDIF